VVFDLGTLLGEFFGVGSSSVPLYMVIFAASNFLGPLLLGRYFDTIGRIPMIAGTYLGSAALVTLLGVLLMSGSLTTWSFMALVLASFFLASAGASSAYLTVSEVFPMETRALAIALFFAVGTAAGGIAGPALFGQFIHSGNEDLVALGFFIGAGAMAVGGVAELLFGVRAEQQSLENIARPLTAEEAEAASPEAPAEPDGSYPSSPHEQRIRQRTAAQRRRARQGLKRLRPGPGRSFYSPGLSGTGGTTSRAVASSNQELDQEVETLSADLETHGEATRDQLRERTRAREWGPGRFRRALRAAVAEGKASRIEGNRYGHSRSDGRED
jgi:MFS family permease